MALQLNTKSGHPWPQYLFLRSSLIAVSFRFGEHVRIRFANCQRRPSVAALLIRACA